GKENQDPDQCPGRVLQPSRIVCGRNLTCHFGFDFLFWRLVWPQPRFDYLVGNQPANDRKHEDGGDAKPKVSSYGHVEIRVHEMDGIVGDALEDAIQWFDQNVDAKYR